MGSMSVLWLTLLLGTSLLTKLCIPSFIDAMGNLVCYDQIIWTNRCKPIALREI